jgi:hypothetical protein
VIRYARFVLSLSFLLPCSAQNPADSIAGAYNGRYHCGQWSDLYMQISRVSHAEVIGPLTFEKPGDQGNDITATVNIYFHRSIAKSGMASYSMTGTYDAKTGSLHVDPKDWRGAHPAGLQMLGLDGARDPATHWLKGKVLNANCDTFELAPPGVAVPPLPVPPAAANPNSVRPEKRLNPTNVTQYLDVAAYSPDFEYWVTAWSDLPGTVHDGEPIDESIADMKGDKFACAGSQHVTWDASGTKGTAPDRVGITERFVVECVGDCKGVTYRPYIGANVTHFGLSAPLPTFQIKSVWAGGTSFRWNFSRIRNTQPPPEIYVHRWTPTTGFGPFDRVHTDAELTGPGCRAPRTGNN